MKILNEAKKLDLIQDVEVENIDDNKKETAQELKSDDVVKVISLFRGVLKLKPPRGSKVIDRYTFNGMFDTQMVTFEFLEALRRANAAELRKPWIYIADEQAVKQLRLEEEYEYILEPKHIEDIFKKRDRDILEFIDKSPKTVKKMLRDVAISKVNSGEINNIGTVRLLKDNLNFQLKEDMR